MNTDRYFAADDFESTEKKKKKKSKKNKREGNELAGKTNPNLLDKFNAMETKYNVSNSLVKTMVDVAAGLLVGPALSAALGKFAPVAGAALSFSGYYTADKTGLLRGIGMGTLAHSLAKTGEYRAADSTFSERLSGLKDDWLRLVFMKNDQPSSPPVNGVPSLDGSKPMAELDPLPDVNAIQAENAEPDNSKRFDLSALDAFEEELMKSGADFKTRSGKIEELHDEPENSLQSADNPWLLEDDEDGIDLTLI